MTCASDRSRRQSRRRVLLRLAWPGVLWASGLPLLPLLPLHAHAQRSYPTRAVTLLVPFAPGGIADLCARTVVEHMGRTLGQPVVVENKPSAGSIVASQAAARARPDGYTLLLVSNANAVSVGLFKRLPYDPLEDFAPVGLIGSFELGLFAPAAGRFATLADALAYARANPGRLNIGTIAPGSTQHLSAKLFETMAGIEALIVPYKGSPAVLTALRAGEVDLAFEVLGPMLPQVQAGAVRALAVTSSRRNPALSGVPTVQQAGVPAYEVESWNGIAAPAATPAPVLATLARALQAALADAGVQQKLRQLGVRPLPGEPAALHELLAREIQRWGAVIRAAKIEPE